MLPFWAIQCTNDENVKNETECGCNGSLVVKNIVNAKATIHLTDSTSLIKSYEIYLDDIEPNANYFSTLTPCDSSVFSKGHYHNGQKIFITGEIKSICTDPNTKLGSSAVVIKKIEVVSTGN
jgi:hypothetical protein